MTPTEKLDLESFIDEVMSPSASFARICMESTDNAPDEVHWPKVKLYDIAEVVGALASLSRYRMHEFAKELERFMEGNVDVIQPTDPLYRVKVQGVRLDKWPESRKEEFKNALDKLYG